MKLKIKGKTYKVYKKDLGRDHGLCNASEQKIWIDTSDETKGKKLVETKAHELMHAYLHEMHLADVLDYRLEEVLCYTVGELVSSHLEWLCEED